MPGSARLPDDARPGRVRLQVADLERSIAYYEGILGLRTLERTDGGASLGADRPLLALAERPGAAPWPRGGRPGLYHFAVLVPDRAALGRFARHLTEAGIPAGASDHRVSEALYLRDPDGLGIEVYRDRPRSAWQRRGGEIVMTTDPLDLEDLRRAAGDAGWDGMPAGTTVGHVHLHVGDLQRAAAFYEAGLGLERTAWSYPGALFLSAGGYHHHLALNTWAVSDRPAGEGDARLLEWELLVPDEDAAAAALRRLEGAGHDVERGAAGGLVRDPWGTALRLRAERGGTQGTPDPPGA